MARLAAVGLTTLLLAGAACIEERTRPGPPRLQITFDRIQVQSPDSLTGSVRAEDADGLDSVWLSVDTARAGEDGFFEAVFSSRFKFDIPTGLAPGTVIPVRLEARDLNGFLGSLDTSVSVIP